MYVYVYVYCIYIYVSQISQINCHKRLGFDITCLYKRLAQYMQMRQFLHSCFFFASPYFKLVKKIALAPFTICVSTRYIQLFICRIFYLMSIFILLDISLSQMIIPIEYVFLFVFTFGISQSQISTKVLAPFTISVSTKGGKSADSTPAPSVGQQPAQRLILDPLFGGKFLFLAPKDL